MINRNFITCSLLCRCTSPRNLQVIHRRLVTHLSPFFHETSRRNGNFPPPPQTNIVVGHVYWCPPTMIAEIMFRFKLFFGKHKVLYSAACILYSVCILYPVCSLQSAFYTDRTQNVFRCNICSNTDLCHGWAIPHKRKILKIIQW